MSTTLENTNRTIHLPTEKAAKSRRKGLRLIDLARGETGRILRVSMEDAGCRKRFAELGLAEGMKVTVASTGETLMLIVGGSRMAVAARCAEAIMVSRV